MPERAYTSSLIKVRGNGWKEIVAVAYVLFKETKHFHCPEQHKSKICSTLL